MGFTDRDGSLQSLLSSTRLSVSLFVYTAVSLSVRLPGCQSLCSSTRLSVSLFVYPPANLSAHLPACQSLCPSTRLPISLSVCIVSVFLYRTVCLHVYLSVSPASLNICPLWQREHLPQESKCCFLLFSPTSFMQPSCRWHRMLWQLRLTLLCVWQTLTEPSWFIRVISRSSSAAIRNRIAGQVHWGWTLALDGLASKGKIDRTQTEFSQSTDLPFGSVCLSLSTPLLSLCDLICQVEKIFSEIHYIYVFPKVFSLLDLLVFEIVGLRFWKCWFEDCISDGL